MKSFRTFLTENVTTTQSFKVKTVRPSDGANAFQQGLMHVKNMPLDEGMFFIFEDEDYHGIWMKNTHIPLDVVWINESGTIVDIATLQPHDLHTTQPNQPAKYILEVNAGEFTGKVGDNINNTELITHRNT
jgi:uncharacterized membrane protein (UPF0127 family)